jgi:hypothetical protein
MSKKQEAATEENLPAVQASHAVATTGDFSEFAGDGFGGTSIDDYAIPFITILQSGSPQTKRNDPRYIEGAQEGDLFNNVTQKVFNGRDGLVLVPCAYKKSFVEWVTREAGGGYVAEYPAESTLIDQTKRDEKNRSILPNGNQLNDTRSFYVLVLDPEGFGTPAVLSMTSTQLKAAKQWLTQMNMLRLKAGERVYAPPMYASKWLATTVGQSNEKGSWSGWHFEHMGYLNGPSDPVFVDAKRMAEDVAKGRLKANMAAAEHTESGATTAAGAGAPAGDDSDIPF